MTFRIDNVGNLERKYIVDEVNGFWGKEKIKIDISGIKTEKGRERLKTFLKKVYDVNHNGVLDEDELDILQETSDGMITEEKINPALKLFFDMQVNPDDAKFTPLMKKAVKKVNEELFLRFGYVKDFEGKPEICDDNLDPIGMKNTKEIQRVSLYYKKLYSALIKLISRSDTHARMILNLFSEDFGFAFNIYDKHNKPYRGESRTGEGTGMIFIPKSTLDAGSVELEDAILHESIHFLDDIKVPDSKTQEKTLIYDVLKNEIKSIGNKDMDILFEMVNKITELEDEFYKLHNKYKDVKPVGEFNGLAIYNPKSAELVKKSVWMWEEDKHGVFSNFIDNYMKYWNSPVVNEAERKSLLDEYIADAARYYLSPDKSKRERLKRFNPQLYNFIEKRYLPLLLNGPRRIKPKH